MVANLHAWIDLPPAHLKVALGFYGEREKRDHEYRIAKTERDQEIQRLEVLNQHRLDVMGMMAAFVISVASVGSAIYFGARHDYWMAGIMLGPTVFAIMKLFITRKADKSDLKAAGGTLGAVTQQGSPQSLQ
ncbi:hypothetical protein GCM10010424_06330 [Streptomyces lienomycini]